MIESALEHTLTLLRSVRIRLLTPRAAALTRVLYFYLLCLPAGSLQSDARLARDPPTCASATWLPYTLIDQVLAAAATHDDLSQRRKSLQSDLQKELAARVKRMQKMSQFSTR